VRCRQQAEEMSANATQFLPAEFADKLVTLMRGRQPKSIRKKYIFYKTKNIILLL
jgi:hypothetical protein